MSLKTWCRPLIKSLGWVATAAVAVSGIAASAQTGFEQPAPVVLPADEGAHKSQLEWWYYVGHLKGVDSRGVQREFGYEVTVFQLWPLPLGPATYSWHLAVTDVKNNLHKVEERVITADIPPKSAGINFTNGGWSVSGAQQNYHIKGNLSSGRFGIDLNTSSQIPFVFHGGNGLVDYRPIATTSAYYSSTALQTTGTVYDNGEAIRVTGISWQDRQWFNKGTALDGGGSFFGGGWNWFAVQLDNNTQYMLYYLQDPVTGIISNKFGTRVVNGVSTPISGSQMGLQVLATWLSPTTLNLYPNKWKVTLPEGQMIVTPQVKNQEMVWPGHRTYWEGTSTVDATLNGQAVSGRSYVEVNPYLQPYASLP